MRLVEKAGAQMVKTTTGCGPSTSRASTPSEGAARPGSAPSGRRARGHRPVPPGARAEDEEELALGGIYDLDTALEMIRAGADQLGEQGRADRGIPASRATSADMKRRTGVRAAGVAGARSN